MTPSTTAEVLARLDRTPLDDVPPLWITVGPWRLRLLCQPALRAELAEYFTETLTGDGPVAATIEVLEGQTLDPAPTWHDWRRDAGKIGRKDATWDLSDGRLIHKRRTGMTFLQSPKALVAFGPCRANPQQIINFVNTQILNHGQRAGWQMCHAAAVTNGPCGLAIAGLSGGGKSTSILRMLDIPGTAFVTNDRLLVRAADRGTSALGIPKQPRINPGTILHNPRLHPLLSTARRAELAALPPADLWTLEEKHDLIVPRIYGPGRVRHDCALTDFWVLNWQHDSSAPTTVRDVSLPDRPDLLAAIMKAPGPFYQDAQGRFRADSDPLDPAAYLAALDGVRVCEIAGRVDFDRLFRAGADLLTPV
ncbi:HprK-related kinase B [Meridianimarinicoccus sp. MJW13]|uniref:HprK-related kinase B n=1 Tax=Meridianimarinicoccus sp. MJW13 TaxID=2720031 RepID=UPI001868D3C9|nr:HprK-related kinase B [Fluviibacterium sp. MJW13]